MLMPRKGFIFRFCGCSIFSLVPFISTSVNNSSVLLLTEICTFLSHYLLNNRELLDRVAAQEVYLIRSLVSLLDVSLYGRFFVVLSAIILIEIVSVNCLFQKIFQKKSKQYVGHK